MTSEARVILNLLESYLEKHSDIRFGQALFNLNINQFNLPLERDISPTLRDIYNDKDKDILKRMTL